MVAQPKQWLKVYPDIHVAQFDGGGWVDTPHSSQVHVGGSIDIRWVGRIPFPSWDDQRHPLITKGDFIGTDNRAWHFICSGSSGDSKLLGFLVDDVGVNASSTVALPVADGEWVGVRVTWNSSTGNVTFYYSTDLGATWTQLGAVVASNPGTINNRGDIEIGRDRYLAFAAAAYQVLWAEIRNGINGTVVARADFTENGPWALGDDHDTNAAKVDSQGNTWTIRRGFNGHARIVNRHFIRTAHLPASEDGIETPHNASLEPSGDFHIRAVVKPNSWASGTSQAILGKGTSTSTAWVFSLRDDGQLNLAFGTTDSIASGVAVPFSDGEWGIVGVDYRSSDGRIRFYAQVFNLDESISTFTRLGTDKTATSGGIPSNTDPLVIGRNPDFSGFGFIGHIAWVVLGHTLASSYVAHPIFREDGPWQVGDVNATGARNDGFGNPWTLQGNTTILEVSDWPLDTDGGLVVGEASNESVRLIGPIQGDLVIGGQFNVNPRIVGKAEGDLIIGGAFSYAYEVQAIGGLILDSEFEIIPPEVVAGVGSVWSIGLAGRGYLLSTLDQEAPFEFRSYEIQAIPQQRPQIDDQDEPGEQTLFPWWARAQHSWHEGSGQEVFDSPFSSRFRYCHGEGIDPWVDGQLSLLKDTEELRSEAVTDHHLWGTPDALFYTFNGNLKRDPDPDATGETDESTLSTHSGTPINSIASDGESIYAAFSGGSLGIKKTPMSGSMSWSDVNVHTAVELIAFVKGRLIGAKGASLYEYDLASTTAPTAFHTDTASTWKWTGITESGPAIYFSGYAGDRSEIFAARLTAQDLPFASISTLGAMRSVWQAPEGETIHTIKGYLGKQVLIGTSRGVRVGTIATGEGDLDVSGLITEQRPDKPRPLNVLKFEPQEDFAWFTWSEYDGTRSGLGRVHLGTLAWASDLLYPISGEVRDVATHQDRRYFVTVAGGTSHIVKEHATDLVPNAKLNLCEIRFGTTEAKALRYFDTRGKGGGTWSLDLSSDGGASIPAVITSPLLPETEHVINLEGGRFKMTMNITRSTTPTEQFILNEWRLRSEPRSTGRFRYLVPIMLYDHMVAINGQPVGSVGYALEGLEVLMELYRTGRDTLFQRLGSGVPGGPTPTLVIMEDLRFKSFTPPKGTSGYGGIALAVLREVR